MKKRFLNLAIALTFVTATALAGNVTSIYSVDAQSLIVDTKNWNSESVSVEIRDAEGVLLFKDDFKNQQRKRLNLKRLPQGVYSIVLSNDMKSTTQFFTVRAKKAIELSEIHTDYKPFISISDEYIDLNYMALDKNTSVSINGLNDQIFTMTIENEKSVNKRFDIQRLPAGTYTFNVSSDNESYSKIFRK